MPLYKPKAKPWDPPDLADPELLALKSLSEGVANAHQQKLAITTIVIKLAGAYDMSWRPGPDGARETDFAEGRRFVGSRILEAVQRPMKERKETDGSSSADQRKDRRNPKPERPKSRPPKPEAGSGSVG